MKDEGRRIKDEGVNSQGFLPSAFCLLPSAFCLLPSAFPPPSSLRLVSHGGMFTQQTIAQLFNAIAVF
ncbi:MAG TPA: hypothetical protein V6D02_14775, partial [Candidatus Obscuribacterales bacterium]